MNPNAIERFRKNEKLLCPVGSSLGPDRKGRGLNASVWGKGDSLVSLSFLHPTDSPLAAELEAIRECVLAVSRNSYLRTRFNDKDGKC